MSRRPLGVMPLVSVAVLGSVPDVPTGEPAGGVIGGVVVGGGVVAGGGVVGGVVIGGGVDVGGGVAGMAAVLGPVRFAMVGLARMKVGVVVVVAPAAPVAIPPWTQPVTVTVWGLWGLACGEGVWAAAAVAAAVANATAKTNR